MLQKKKENPKTEKRVEVCRKDRPDYPLHYMRGKKKSHWSQYSYSRKKSGHLRWCTAWDCKSNTLQPIRQGCGYLWLLYNIQALGHNQFTRGRKSIVLIQNQPTLSWQTACGTTGMGERGSEAGAEWSGAGSLGAGVWTLVVQDRKLGQIKQKEFSPSKIRWLQPNY